MPHPSPSGPTRFALAAMCVLLTLPAMGAQEAGRPSSVEEEDVSGPSAGTTAPAEPGTIRISKPFQAHQIRSINAPDGPVVSDGVAIPSNARAPRKGPDPREDGDGGYADGYEAYDYDDGSVLYGYGGNTTLRSRTFRQRHRGGNDRGHRRTGRRDNPGEYLASNDGFARAQYAFYKSGNPPRPASLSARTDRVWTSSIHRRPSRVTQRPTQRPIQRTGRTAGSGRGGRRR